MVMRGMVVVGLVALLSAAGSVQAEQPGTQPQPLLLAKVDTQDGKAKKAKKKKPKKICRREKETGSRIAKRVCRTEEQWASQDGNTRDSLDRTYEESRRNTATVGSQ